MMKVNQKGLVSLTDQDVTFSFCMYEFLLFQNPVFLNGLECIKLLVSFRLY
jgi:hypothetical protein